MSIPDFTRAEYTDPRATPHPGILEGAVRRPASSALPVALLFGVAAALLGSVVYAVIGFSGFMVSIVAIGVGYLVARAMMTATGGVGNRALQVSAVLLTYLAVTLGDLIDLLHYSQVPLRDVFQLPPSVLLRELAFGPFLAMAHPVNGILGLIIIFVGLRTAWRMAAGSPGFGSSGGQGITPFGLR